MIGNITEAEEGAIFEYLAIIADHRKRINNADFDVEIECRKLLDCLDKCPAEFLRSLQPTPNVITNGDKNELSKCKCLDEEE